jgi:hypothetical protein
LIAVNSSTARQEIEGSQIIEIFLILKILYQEVFIRLDLLRACFPLGNSCRRMA